MRTTQRCIISDQASLFPRLIRSSRALLVLLIAAALWLFLTPTSSLAQSADVIYVRHNATGANNGTSWSDAYTDLQSALGSATSGQEIWVAEGVYLPTSVTTDRSATFRLLSGVEIYGGFAATETQRTQRDLASHRTVLSGDIDKNDITVVTGVTQDAGSIVGSNAYHVVIADASVAETAVIDGFTVTGGQANDADENSGGGFLIMNSAWVVLRNMTIVGNTSSKTGGGAAVSRSAATISQCEFRNNSSQGALALDGGGGLYTYQSTVIVTSSIFSGNYAQSLGGGLLHRGESVSSSEVTMNNVLVFANYAVVGGGGIASRYSDYRLTNCTITANEAGQRGGGLYTNNSLPVIRNAVVWANVPYLSYFGSTPPITYSTIQGVSSGTGNLAQAPVFVGPSVGDYRLMPTSAAIDAGDPDASALPTTDLDGNPRVVDGNGFDGPQVDMGAYEWPGYELTVDIVGQGQVARSPEGTHYPPGFDVTLTASSTEGWAFAGWGGDASGTDPSAIVEMTGSRVVTATFTSPSAVTMGSFSARSTPSGMLLTWDTATEIDMLGVTLRRRTLPDGPWVDLNRGEMIPVQGPGQLLGASYSYLDTDVQVGEHYTYLLEMVGFGPLATGPDAQHTVDARYWGYFWWLPILRGHVFSGP